MQYDLAVIIPGRNEEFISRTIEGVLANKRGKTEVIAGLDETWASPPLKDHPDLTVIHYSESIGQRSMSNKCVQLTNARMVVKLDAHSIVSEGFDVELLKGLDILGKDVVQIPILYNLHAFDRVCPKCKHRIYQGPEPIACEKCKTIMVREMVWKPRFSRKSEFYRFDTDLHFQYHSARKKQVPVDEIYPETMSAQGSCFAVSREKYWEWNLGDEEFGSWGSQGSQIACSAWLSGGRVVTNRKCWYSHLFRTQGQSFGFPYPQSGRQVEHSRVYLRKLFMDNTFKKQIYPLSWLIEKFKPLPGWHDPEGKEKLDYINKKGEEWNLSHKVVDGNKTYYDEEKKIDNFVIDKKNLYRAVFATNQTKGIVFYTRNKVNLRLGHAVRKQILKAGLPVVSVSSKPMNFGIKNIHISTDGSFLEMAKKILAGLEEIKTDIVFFCEDDVLYHPTHFEFVPMKRDTYYYDKNVWRIRSADGFALHYDAKQLNMICGYRDFLIEHYKKRVLLLENFIKNNPKDKVNGYVRAMGFEPGTHNRKERVDEFVSEYYTAEYPSLDIRHDTNLTANRWRKDQFRNQKNCQNWHEDKFIGLPGWPFQDPALGDKDFKELLHLI